MVKAKKKSAKSKLKSRKKAVKKRIIKKKTIKKKGAKRKAAKKQVIRSKKIPSIEYKFEKYIKKEKKKFSHKPFLAALLNFFLWGAGFIYIGRFIYGVLWLFVGAFLMVPSIRMQQFLPPRIALYFSIGYLLISTLLAVDAYFDAVEIEGWK